MLLATIAGLGAAAWPALAQTGEDGMAIVERHGTISHDARVTVRVRCVVLPAATSCGGHASLRLIHPTRRDGCRRGTIEVARVAFSDVPVGAPRTVDAALRRRARCVLERRCLLRVSAHVVPERAPAPGTGPPDVAQPVVVLRNRLARACA